MPEWLAKPWPWYVAGPLIGLVVPALLILGNKHFGISSNLRHMCAAVLPTRAEYFRYEWKRSGAWNLVFLVGVLAGGLIGGVVLGANDVAISEGARRALAALGITDFSGLVPRELIGWSALLSAKGLVLIVVGGFLVGFGTAYAGGCTSGHGITGLANLERASLVAVLGFFAGGLLATFILLPLIL
jgi:hypothetical protein